MNAATFTITDANTGAAVTGALDDIEDTVRGWFAGETEDEFIGGAVEDFFAGIRAGDHRDHVAYGGAESYLGLTVE